VDRNKGVEGQRICKVVYYVIMERRKTTLYLDEDLIKAVKIASAREGRREYQIVESALRAYFGRDLLEQLWRRNRLSEEAALAVAYDELKAERNK